MSALRTGTRAIKALANAYRDDFAINTVDEQEFLAAAQEYGMSRDVEKVSTEDLTFYPMPQALDAYKLEALGLPGHCIQDTINNKTVLYMEYQGEPMLLRDTALSSITERMRIKGTVLSDIPPKMLADHLNNYAQYAGEKGKMITNHGKVHGIMGKDYSLLPAEDIMLIASDFMKSQGALFDVGSISHRVLRATWEMGDCTIELPITAGQSTEKFSQTVEISTSDCGMRSVNVFPIMRKKDDSVGLAYCLPLRMEHKGDASLDKFNDMLDLLTRRMENAMHTVKRLSGIQLMYPANVLLALLKWLDIPTKYGAVVFEKKKIQWEGQDKTAFDVYSTLSEVAALTVLEVKNKRTIAEYQESYMRGLQFKFSDFDAPGEYGYNTTVIGSKAVSRKGNRN